MSNADADTETKAAADDMAGDFAARMKAASSRRQELEASEEYQELCRLADERNDRLAKLLG